ncbi:Ovochymase-1 [Bulinus truncatus]|nr:Ovochymase-1 [Bulinus truncatus]
MLRKMIHLQILVAVFVVSVAPSAQFQTRMVGGVDVGSCETYPWMVLLNTDSFFQVCAGTILDARHILTAAHCLIFSSRVTATVGEYDASVNEGTEQVFEIDMVNGVSIHPDFSLRNKTNDVAILTLSTPIDLTKKCAAPFLLHGRYNLLSGQKCQIAGWGSVIRNSPIPSGTLQTAAVTVYRGSDCAAAFPNAPAGFATDPETQLCAGEPAGDVDPCMGDDGAPLFCMDDVTSRWKLVGMVSYGYGCETPGLPDVYTHVSVFYPWILGQLKKT